MKWFLYRMVNLRESKIMGSIQSYTVIRNTYFMIPKMVFGLLNIHCLCMGGYCKWLVVVWMWLLSVFSVFPTCSLFQTMCFDSWKMVPGPSPFPTTCFDSWKVSPVTLVCVCGCCICVGGCYVSSRVISANSILQTMCFDSWRVCVRSCCVYVGGCWM